MKTSPLFIVVIVQLFFDVVCQVEDGGRSGWGGRTCCVGLCGCVRVCVGVVRRRPCLLPVIQSPCEEASYSGTFLDLLFFSERIPQMDLAALVDLTLE